MKKRASYIEVDDVRHELENVIAEELPTRGHPAYHYAVTRKRYARALHAIIRQRYTAQLVLIGKEQRPFTPLDRIEQTVVTCIRKPREKNEIGAALDLVALHARALEMSKNEH